MIHDWLDGHWARPAGKVDERILPDGCSDIVFRVDDGTAMVVGAMTRPLLLRGSAPSYFGVRFKPGRAATFLRFPLDEITDGSAEFGDRTLAEQVAEARTAEARIGI